MTETKQAIIEQYTFVDTLYSTDGSNRFLSGSVIDEHPYELPEVKAYSVSGAGQTELINGVEGVVPFSVSFWLKGDYSGYNSLYFNYQSASDVAFDFQNRSTMSVAIDTVSTFYSTYPEEWVNFILTFDPTANKIKLYRNKILVNTVTDAVTFEKGFIYAYDAVVANIITFNKCITEEELTTVYSNFKNPMPVHVTHIPLPFLIRPYMNVITISSIPILDAGFPLIDVVCNEPLVQGQSVSVFISEIFILNIIINPITIYGYETIYAEVKDLSIVINTPNYFGEFTSEGVPPVDPYPNNKVFAQQLVLEFVAHYLQHPDNAYVQLQTIQMGVVNLTQGIWSRALPETLTLSIHTNASIAQNDGRDKRVTKLGTIVFDRALYWSGVNVVKDFISTTAITVNGETIYSVTPLKKYTKSYEISTKTDIIVGIEQINELRALILTDEIRVEFTDGSWEYIKFDLLGSKIKMMPIFDGSDKYYLTIGVLL